MKIGNLPAKMIALFLVTAGAILILMYYYSAAGGDLPFSGDKYKLTAIVREPQGLQKHADVRAAGVKVGSVSDITPEGTSAKVLMKLDKKIVPVYNDATVLVRQKTLVGENYIELTRGNPKSGELKSGASLAPSRDLEAVPLDRILNSLDAKTRADISGSIKGVGGGFAGRGQDFNDLLASLRPTISDGSRVTDILDAQKLEVADIIDQAGTIFQAIGDRKIAMQTLITSAKTTAEAVSARDKQFKAAFDEFPSTLKQAQLTVHQLSGFSGRATPVVNDLRTGLVALRPVLRDLAPTARETTKLFNQLGPFIKVADPMLSRLQKFTKTAAPLFPALQTMLRQTNPALDYMKPYYRDTVAFLANFGLNDIYDQNGAVGYCTCPVNDRSFSNWTAAERKALSALLDSGIFAKVGHLANNPVRKPGSLPDSTTPFSGTYPRIEAAPGK